MDPDPDKGDPKICGSADPVPDPDPGPDPHHWFKSYEHLKKFIKSIAIVNIQHIH
jgi:hypothetical protein